MRFLKTKRKLLSKHFLHLIDYYSTISNFTNMNMNINSVSLKHFVLIEKLIEKHPIHTILLCRKAAGYLRSDVYFDLKRMIE